MTENDIQNLINQVNKILEQNKEFEIKEKLLLEELNKIFDCSSVKEGKEKLEELQEEWEKSRKQLKKEAEELQELLEEKQWT